MNSVLQGEQQISCSSWICHPKYRICTIHQAKCGSDKSSGSVVSRSNPDTRISIFTTVSRGLPAIKNGHNRFLILPFQFIHPTVTHSSQMIQRRKTTE